LSPIDGGAAAFDTAGWPDFARIPSRQAVALTSSIDTAVSGTRASAPQLGHLASSPGTRYFTTIRSEHPGHWNESAMGLFSRTTKLDFSFPAWTEFTSGWGEW
jgi:hypothetical protein